MKIELKKIEFNERMSEETNCFVADLYINGKHVGYVKNDGHGGQTDYYGIEKRQSDIIREAEEYCKTLPKVKYGNMEWDNSLENVIDQLFEDWILAKERRKKERKMQTCILVGKPDAMMYSYYNFKRPLSSIPKATLELNIKRIKEKHQGEEILNTNLEALGITV